MTKIKKKQLKETTKSGVYKKYLNYNLRCDFCSPNKGCNRIINDHRSWKRYRKHQWKD